MAVLKREEPNYSAELNVHDVHTILGPEAKFEGKLAFEGTVRIDGRFRGEIRTNDVLVVGQGAHVEAKIHAGSVVINGSVTGDIKATQCVEIHPPGRLEGDIETPQLMIDKGVVFQGTCKMDQRPPKQAHGHDKALESKLAVVGKEGKKS